MEKLDFELKLLELSDEKVKLLAKKFGVENKKPKHFKWEKVKMSETESLKKAEGFGVHVEHANPLSKELQKEMDKIELVHTIVDYVDLEKLKLELKKIGA